MEHSPNLAAVVLAAGKGKRMGSELPKVLHTICGKALVSYPVEAALEIGARPVVVVVGHGAELVREALATYSVVFAEQHPQMGTGHALMCALNAVAGLQERSILVLCGDVPGIRPSTLRALVDHHFSSGNRMTILAMDLPDPGSYGRIVLGDDGRVRAIVEGSEPGAPQGPGLVNAGVYVLEGRGLAEALGRLKRDNAQGEYYLTDLAQLFSRQGHRVGYHLCGDPAEVAGVNTVQELEEIRRRFREARGECAE